MILKLLPVQVELDVSPSMYFHLSQVFAKEPLAFFVQELKFASSLSSLPSSLPLFSYPHSSSVILLPPSSPHLSSKPSLKLVETSRTPCLSVFSQLERVSSGAFGRSTLLPSAPSRFVLISPCHVCLYSSRDARLFPPDYGTSQTSPAPAPLPPSAS